jgi:serine phosphatase RsbU (regulator of sigma subunit)
MEVWGGIQEVSHVVSMPGLAGWVHSAPIKRGTGGGDVFYLSVCNQGLLSRISLADVMGHGSEASPLASRLRGLMNEHINTWDQSSFMRALNDTFKIEARGARYATAIVLGFHRLTGQLVFTNAGHPAPLWYRATDRNWFFLQDGLPFAEAELAGLPLGLIAGTNYYQTAIRLGVGDLLVLYSDGYSDELSGEAMLERVRTLPTQSPEATGLAFLALFDAVRDGTPASDDETAMVFQCVDAGSV